MKTIVKENKNLILEFIISVIITKLGIGLFGIEKLDIAKILVVFVITTLITLNIGILYKNTKFSILDTIDKEKLKTKSAIK